jgi:hypothetical protein
VAFFLKSRGQRAKGEEQMAESRGQREKSRFVNLMNKRNWFYLNYLLI